MSPSRHELTRWNKELIAPAVSTEDNIEVTNT